jgi:hypothetical protein
LLIEKKQKEDWKKVIRTASSGFLVRISAILEKLNKAEKMAL